MCASEGITRRGGEKFPEAGELSLKLFAEPPGGRFVLSRLRAKKKARKRGTVLLWLF